MKNFSFFKRCITGIIVLVIFLFVGTEIFQGQKIPIKLNEKIFDYDENNPYIDRPTREALSHVVEKGDDDLDLITDAQGFDNFEIGVDFAEQMLVSNPRDPLSMQFGVNNSSTGQNSYYTANGYDWTQSNPAYHSSICCDPWSAWDSLGNLFYGSGVSGQYIYKSINGGQSYGSAVLSVSGNDRNTLAADQTNGPFRNYLYAAITPGNFARSTNSGATWTQTYTASNTIPGVMIAVGPNGATQGGCVIYVTNTGSSQNVTYTFHRSINGGASGSFSVMSSLTTAGYVGTLNSAGRLVINNGRTRPYPMIAMDNSYGPHRGRLYLVYASNVPAGNGNKPDIRLRYSDDQAATWSAGVTVNDNANPQLSDQWFPAIWCEKETGRLYIKWYDTRENPATYAVNVYATYTDDGGATFAPNQKLTTTSWTYPNPPCPANSNCYRGDYDGCTANPRTSFNVWYDGRAGTYKNIGAYFPDFGMLASPAVNTVHQTNSSVNYLISIPAVKLYTDVTTFSATVSPVPATGSIEFEFPGGNTLSTYPNTKYVKVKTVGTVPPGAYTVTIIGQGGNGTPVHKRTVSLTVNSTVGPDPCESFAGLKFPPADFFEEFSGSNYWTRETQTAYGIGGSGSARFNSWSAPDGTIQSIVSNNFPSAAANTYLTFDNAYGPGAGGNNDSLFVEASSDFGASYFSLARLWGGLGAQAGPLNTVFTAGGQFVPSSSEWAPKIYLLPVGTNKIRMRARSGNGNDIWIDNVCVQVLTAPITNSIGIVPEGMFNCSPPFLTCNDTVKVFLCRSDYPNVRVDSAYGTISTGATWTGLFSRALDGMYYILMDHRNTINTWSNSGKNYTRGVILNFNFITPSGQSYANNQKHKCLPNDWWAMFSGDVNKNGIIDGIDLAIIDNAVSNFVMGYVNSDLNCDNQVNALDAAIADNNAYNIVSEQAPPGAKPEVISFFKINKVNENQKQPKQK